jgi:hypothetical protein
LKAGEKYTLKGNITQQHQTMQNFDGFLDMVLWDAPTAKKTLANQSTSQAVAVETQEQAIFKGKATVQNGQFEISFILPGNMPSSNLAALKLQLYAYNDSIDASTQFQSIYVQGTSIQSRLDTAGPQIKAYINSPYFKSWDWVSAPANLVVVLKDSSGIQSSGNELGHDLKLTINDSLAVSYNLNPFFTYDSNQYQSGKIQYPLPNLSEGKHRLILKAWDLIGNVSKDTIWVEVPALKNSMLRNLSIMPNPVQLAAKFNFEVKKTDPFFMQLEVYDLSGRIHFSAKEQVEPQSNRIVINWDGLSSKGGLLPPGLYYYKVLVQQNGATEQLTNSFIKF